MFNYEIFLLAYGWAKNLLVYFKMSIRYLALCRRCGSYHNTQAWDILLASYSLFGTLS